jgi:hypothetical protein
MLNGRECPVAMDYDEEKQTLVVSPPDLSSEDEFSLHIKDMRYPKSGLEERVSQLKSMVSAFDIDNTGKQVLYESTPAIAENADRLSAFRVLLSPRQMQALLEVAMEAGVHNISHTNEHALLMWNRKGDPAVTYEISREHYRRWLSSERFQTEKDRVPPYKGFLINEDLKETRWYLTLRYGEFLTVGIADNQKVRRD